MECCPHGRASLHTAALLVIHPRKKNPISGVLSEISIVGRNVLPRDYEVTDTFTSVGDGSLAANRNSIASATCSSVM